jgi:hypothetical protein
MSKKLLGIIILCFQLSFSQTETGIEEKVTSFFEHLNQKNHQQLASFFEPNAQLQSAIVKDAVTQVQLESVEEFLNAIQQIPNEVAIEEKISQIYIQVDGPIAFASMEYEFYIDATFSHQGTNYFHFILIAEKWMISHILDSRIYPK